MIEGVEQYRGGFSFGVTLFYVAFPVDDVSDKADDCSGSSVVESPAFSTFECVSEDAHVGEVVCAVVVVVWVVFAHVSVMSNEKE